MASSASVVRFGTGEIKMSQNTMKLAVPRMPKSCMPEVGVAVRQEGVSGQSFIGGGVQWVELVGGVTSEHNRPRSEILD
jgi:hypothetical protein